jgi:hypothetical protein
MSGLCGPTTQIDTYRALMVLLPRTERRDFERLASNELKPDSLVVPSLRFAIFYIVGASPVPRIAFLYAPIFYHPHLIGLRKKDTPVMLPLLVDR